MPGLLETTEKTWCTLNMALPCEQSPSIFLDNSVPFLFPDLSRKDRSDSASRVIWRTIRAKIHGLEMQISYLSQM